MLPEARVQLSPLPVGDFSVRFVDGDNRCGARQAADILAETLRRQGLDCTASRERPVVHVQGRRGRGALRFAGEESGRADLLVVLDESLLARADLRRTLNPDGTLVVATPRAPHAVRRGLRWFGGTTATVDAEGISDETGAEPAAALLGALARATGFIDPDILGTVTWIAYDRLWPYAAVAATRALSEGYRRVQF
ncbi:2-oxoacid:acceptor oxidoreductase family protein [Caldinitratiruptor microaerophilus]|uniref:Pyruvate/ketoisovalerate oxidoreductase catalytic domain-containing protein n=1 Tax=Caldinitratiruptor microaerophilus TaxID=671077 RepID=A0AA35CKJ8_9FIRM|nr:2-oxoacid:acceptor oxidoreductase family protein [Caldinitratiruptor microaerophilus]BDG59020.1 hypothetical protein caldi_01100 [Caldinitratiruptor microaerophilus]